MANTFKDEDLLYTLAYECEALFDHLRDTLRKTKSSDAILSLCEEFQQRFAIWAAHLGVFARQSQCLDTRLRNSPDLQDLVARLLDILRRSLQQCTVGSSGQGATDHVVMEIHDLPPGAPQLQTSVLKTIDDTLARLNRLGVTIRQAGRGKLDFRAKRFAAGLDLSSFAHLCANAVQSLYPGAHQALKDHLSRSMTDRYARMLFLDSRHQNLQTRRELHIGLPPIHEVPNGEMPTPNPSHRPRMAIRNIAVQRLLRQPPALSQSDLSSVNLQQIRNRLRPPDEASTKFHKTSSLQVNQGNYPRISATADGSTVITCQWCSEPLVKNTLSESQWRRHIDRDLKPYVCLSEACRESHPAYATFEEWHKHMELHDWRWHQRTYLTSSWVCTICEFNSDAYTSPQALYSHLEKSHSSDFTLPQLQAISRQSKTEQPRASNDCLLCCFAVEEQGNFGEAVFPKRRKGQTKHEASKSARRNFDMAHPSPHNSDFDSSDTSSDSDGMVSNHRKQRGKGRSMAVSRHVAVHLQVLMLLTLRFAAALQDNDGDGDEDARSDSVDIDEGGSASDGADLGRLSNIASEDVTMKDGSDGASATGDVILDESLDDNLMADDMPVPDTDIDLQFIPRQYDDLAVEDDEFLNELIESGDFIYGEDQPSEFSISKAITAATRVALAPVNIIEGIGFDFSNDGDAGGGGKKASDDPSSHIGDHIHDTFHERTTSEQPPDGLSEPVPPNTDIPGEQLEGLDTSTMTDDLEDNQMGTIEDALTAKGVTINDRILGKGRAAKQGDHVVVSRTARLQNGEGFDASWKFEGSSDNLVIGKSRLAGASGEVFSGWELGIIGMAVGGERRLVIPAHLAEFKNLKGAPSNCQLTYDIKLLEILDEGILEAESFNLGASTSQPPAVPAYDTKGVAASPYGTTGLHTPIDPHPEAATPPRWDNAPSTYTDSGYPGLTSPPPPGASSAYADFELGVGKDEPSKEAVDPEMDYDQHKPSPSSPGRIQTTADMNKVGLVEAQKPARREKKWILEEIEDTRTTAASANWDFQNGRPIAVPASYWEPLDQVSVRGTGRSETHKASDITARPSPEGFKTPYSDIEPPNLGGNATNATRNVKEPRPVKACTECRSRKLRCDRLFPCSRCIERDRYCSYASNHQSANLSNGSDAEGAKSGHTTSNLALRPTPDEPLEHSSAESPSSGTETGPRDEVYQAEASWKAAEEPDSVAALWDQFWRDPSPARRLNVEELDETHQVDVSPAANCEPESSTRSLHDAETPPYESADAEEDTRPRLKRVGHVQFDEFAEIGAHFHPTLDNPVSKGTEEAGHPSILSSVNATTRFEFRTASRGSQKSGNPFRNPFDIVEGSAVSETEKHMCTVPGCGKSVKDQKAHMLTHQLELSEKCPFTTCRYNIEGFARRYDRNCHLLTHYEGTMLCGFCPGSGLGAEESFVELDAFKEHLSAVHGVEQTPLDRRRARNPGPMGPKTLAHGPDATSGCSICLEFFINVQDFYDHLDGCVDRFVQQTSGSEPWEGGSGAQAQVQPHDKDNSEEMMDWLAMNVI